MKKSESFMVYHKTGFMVITRLGGSSLYDAVSTLTPCETADLDDPESGLVMWKDESDQYVLVLDTLDILKRTGGSPDSS